MMMFRNLMRMALLALGLALVCAPALATDVEDGNAIVAPARGDRYSIDGVTMGKAELYGYLGDLRDTESLTGVVIKRGASDEQRRVIASIAKGLSLKAFEQDGRELKPLQPPAE
jgi:hypothetical protein